MKQPDRVKQALAIDLFAHPGMTVEKVAYEVDVHPNTVVSWRKDPAFMEAVVNQARRNLRNRLPEILDRLADEAAQGHHQHAKIVLDYLDRLEERQREVEQGQITFSWRVSTPSE